MQLRLGHASELLETVGEYQDTIEHKLLGLWRLDVRPIAPDARLCALRGRRRRLQAAKTCGRGPSLTCIIHGSDGENGPVFSPNDYVFSSRFSCGRGASVKDEELLGLISTHRGHSPPSFPPRGGETVFNGVFLLIRQSREARIQALNEAFGFVQKTTILRYCRAVCTSCGLA